MTIISIESSRQGSQATGPTSAGPSSTTTDSPESFTAESIPSPAGSAHQDPQAAGDETPSPHAQAFEQGYDAAARELLSNLVWMAEDFLSAQSRPSVADRKLLYGFVALLEKRLCHMQSEAGVVEGGLGI